MSNLFYNRYVPPSIKPQDVEFQTDTLSERPRKRPKTAKPAVSEKAGPEDPGHQKLRSKYEKSRKPADQRPQNGDPGQLPEAAVEPQAGDHNSEQHGENAGLKDPQHQKLRSKYEKSKKPADQRPQNEDLERLVEAAVEPQVGDGNSEQHGLVPIPQPAPAPNPPKASLSAALPDWIRNPYYVSSDLITNWDDLPLPSTTIEALKGKSYPHALPIQHALCQSLLPNQGSRYNGDLCVSAATGSGKTLAYALPMIENLRGMPARKLRGLVIVPTRELVAQSKGVLELCAHGSRLQIGTAVGTRTLKEERDMLVKKGERYDIQTYLEEKSKTVDELEELMNWDFDAMREPVNEVPLLPGWVVDYRSKVDILVCTPGRLVEHINSTKGFNLHSVQWMVIDEADRLLDDSFQQWVNAVIPQFDYLPPLKPLDQNLHHTFRILRKREVKKILLSATMTRDVSQLMALKLSTPRLVVLESEKREDMKMGQEPSADDQLYTIPSSMAEIAINVDETTDKPLCLLEFLENGLQRPGPSHNDRNRRGSSLVNGNLKKNSDSSSGSDNETSSPSSATNNSGRSTSSPSHGEITTSSTRGTLIFTSSTSTTTRLARLISALRPLLSPHIHAFTKYTSKQDRKKALSAFAKPNDRNLHLPSFLPVIITTDILSHGIDIPALQQVVNYSVPASVKVYIHRVGRTARADLPGTAVTLLENQQARWFWTEIARASAISRSGKVARGKVDMSRWGEDERELYQRALAELGHAAQG